MHKLNKHLAVLDVSDVIRDVISTMSLLDDSVNKTIQTDTVFITHLSPRVYDNSATGGIRNKVKKSFCYISYMVDEAL